MAGYGLLRGWFAGDDAAADHAARRCLGGGVVGRLNGRLGCGLGRSPALRWWKNGWLGWLRRGLIGERAFRETDFDLGSLDLNRSAKIFWIRRLKNFKELVSGLVFGALHLLEHQAVLCVFIKNEDDRFFIDRCHTGQKKTICGRSGLLGGREREGGAIQEGLEIHQNPGPKPGGRVEILWIGPQTNLRNQKKKEDGSDGMDHGSDGVWPGGR